MTILLDEPETIMAAQRLAALTRMSVADAIKVAVQERAREFSWGDAGSAERTAAKLKWFAELDARPRTLDPRSWKEVEEQEYYDEFGSPI